MRDHPTIIAPAQGEPASAGSSAGLPLDLLGQSAERLRILALLYAFTFFMAGVFPALALPNERDRFLANVVLWGPAVVGIIVGVLVAVAVRSPRVPLPAAMRLAPIFEIVSSYAIAAAEFADLSTLETHQGFLGLSWVAVWVLLFTVVVPTSPRRALLAALASISSVPVVVALPIATGATTFRIDPLLFFFGLVFPYLLVVAMAYVGARVVYNLGTEVRRARELGSYRLEEKLGEGGMGEVWRARHRMLARPAAIKLIRASAGASQEAARRFEREAQVIASLRSPHTVELFDFGVAADGAFYYVMELLDGLDADSLIRRFGPVPPGRAVHLLRQICHSLSEAQSHGLVHRDIKPANIFLCRYGEEYDFVKVLDFGIVGTVGDGEDASAVQTRENAVQGTPAFIAPEQAMGGEVDGTGRYLRHRLRGVLAADRAVRVHCRHADGADPPARPDSAHATLRTDEPDDSPGARGAGAVLPREGSGGPAAVRPGTVGSARRDRGCRRLDPGEGGGMVGYAPAGEALTDASL